MLRRATADAREAGMAWRKAATVADLDSSEVIGVEIDGQHVALYRLDGTYYATDGICTHQHAFLSEGYVEDGCIECPIHQALFDIKTGKVVDGPADIPLPTYPVKLEGETILVDLPD